MHLSVTSGEKRVEIHIGGKSIAKLEAAEHAARRLLDATPEPEPQLPLGFTATADTERACP